MAQTVTIWAEPRPGTHWEYLVPILPVHLLACLAFLPWCFSWSGVALAVGGAVVFGTLGINRHLRHPGRAAQRREEAGS
jgi:stearoyl-CoA desaturase (delta-9 desaturase)